MPWFGRRQKLKNAAEWDVFSGWRRWLCYTSKAGVCKSVKRDVNKRARQEAKQEIESELEEFYNEEERE
jgi:hypothetical protein